MSDGQHGYYGVPVPSDIPAGEARPCTCHPEDLLAVYDECADIAVPAKATPFEQVEAYRDTIRLLKERAAKRACSK